MEARALFEKQRHKCLVDLVDEKEFVSVNELANHLDASLATIRRDIIKLTSQGMIQRIRGGARSTGRGPLAPRRMTRPSIWGNVEQNYSAKRAIARRAVELCEDGETIIINGGSTTYMMLEPLADRQLNILTNALAFANDLAEESSNRISVPGGEIYRDQNIIMSVYDNDSIDQFRATKMFMGTPGIGKMGVMESDPLLIRAESRLRAQAESLIVLADSTKIGVQTGFGFCKLDDVHVLITDSGVDKSALTVFEDHDVHVEIVELDNDDEPNEVHIS